MGFKGQITESELQDLALPKLRIFLSVDVVGSTAFKHQSERADAQGWLDLFTSFYTEFPEFLAQEREKLIEKRSLTDEKMPTPHLWKALGDELIFVAVLTHRNQAECLLTAFRNAVGRSITKFGHGEKPLPISFKATAWLAGFPVGNAAIPVDTQAPDGSEVFDFVGPMLDIGFRISRYSTPRRLAISVELAYLVLVAGNTDLAFYYEGKEPLKGVLRGRGYPIIWLDSYSGLHDGDKRLEHQLTGAEDGLLERKEATKAKLKEFCEKFILDIGEPLFMPFIHENQDAELREPDDYADKLAEVSQRLRDVFTVRADESQQGGGNDPIGEVEDWDPPVL